MRTVAAITTAAALLGTAAAFVPPTLPSASRPAARAAATKMMLTPDDILTGTQNLIAISKEVDVYVKNAGDYPWGSVQAPDWALPVAAIATLSFGVLIPLILKPGVDSFNAGGAVGAEKKAAQAGLQPVTKIGAKKPVAKPAAKAGPAKAAGKVMAKGGAVAKGGAKAAAAAAPAPKKKGWF